MDNCREKFSIMTPPDTTTCKTKPESTNSIRSCNVCGATCKNRCSLCGLAYYCSVNCQRKDWKTHKKVCKTNRIKKKKPKPGLQLESLPDEILVKVGHYVAGLSGVAGFVRLALTSKRFHRILMAKETVSNVLETQNKYIFDNFFPSNHLIPKATNLEELSFCEYVSTMTMEPFGVRNRLYYEERQVVSPEKASSLSIFIVCLLHLNRSAVAVLDAHSDLETHRGLTGMHTEIMGREICQNIKVRLGRSMAMPKEDLADVLSRIRIRGWGNRVTVAVARRSDDAHGREIRLGKGWVDVFFRMGDRLELPPRPDFYSGILPMPQEKLFVDDANDFDKLNFDTRPPDVDPKEYFFSLLSGLTDEENYELVLEAMLIELRRNGRTSLGPEVDVVLRDVLRQRGMDPLARESANRDPRDILLEMINRAHHDDDRENEFDPDETLFNMVCRFHRYGGSARLGPFVDDLLLDMINQRAESSNSVSEEISPEITSVYPEYKGVTTYEFLMRLVGGTSAVTEGGRDPDEVFASMVAEFVVNGTTHGGPVVDELYSDYLKQRYQS